MILYTTDVTETNVRNTFDVGSAKMKLEQAFLSELDSEQIKTKLIEKIKQGKILTDENLMQYIILPLTYTRTEQKNNTIKELFALTKEIKEKKIQLFLLSEILVFIDRVINEKTAKK